MRTCFIFIAIVALLVGCGGGPEEQGSAKQADAKPYDFSYNRYRQILSEYVDSGLVDYGGLKADRGGLDTLVAALATADLSQATPEMKLAFYINAYNMIVLRTVVDTYPVNSISEIDGALDGKRWNVAGEMLTLDQIQNGMLLKELNEPRAMIAITRAAKGWPAFVAQPYYFRNLSDQLQLVSRYFSTNDQYNSIDPATGEADLSPVFKWFGAYLIPRYYDNGLFSNLCKEENAAVCFVIKHHIPAEQQRLFAADYRVKYHDFDWGLNDRQVVRANSFTDTRKDSAK